MVDELFILTQPAHLQKQFSDKLSAEERDLLRADMVRDRLKHVSRPDTKPPSVRGIESYLLLLAWIEQSQSDTGN